MATGTIAILGGFPAGWLAVGFTQGAILDLQEMERQDLGSLHSDGGKCTSDAKPPKKGKVNGAKR